MGEAKRRKQHRERLLSNRTPPSDSPPESARHGRGPGKKPRRPAVTIRLDAPAYARLQELADQQSTTVSQLVRLAVNGFVALHR
jgi:hypothetical protein